MKFQSDMLAKSTPIEVIIADDHEIFRDGFRFLLNKIPSIKLIGEAADGKELIERTRELKPDIIITDIKMPRMNGIEATKQLVKEFPHIGIISFSMFEEDNLIIAMLEAGAKGYLIKNADKEEIEAAIKSVYKDNPYYCRYTTGKLEQMIAKSSYNPYTRKFKPEFSVREISIMKLICEQCSNAEIGDRLTLSRRTVEGYREKIMEKINARNSTGIVIYAIKNDIYV